MNKINEIQEMIRVNHAGETGAIVIYEGQIAALKLKNDRETLKLVEEMKDQEIEHHRFFCDKLLQKQIRPTLMQPIWQIGGFALGFLTALAGKKAAMVCTTAVEEVIDEHYLGQINQLEEISNSEAKDGFSQDLQSSSHQEIIELKNKIEKFRADECQHRDIAYENDAKNFFAFTPLSLAIKTATKLAIKISKKI